MIPHYLRKGITKVYQEGNLLMVRIGRLAVINVHFRPSGMRSLEIKRTAATILETKERWEREGGMGKVTTIGGDVNVQLAGNVEVVTGNGTYTNGEGANCGRDAW